eukprot:scaffold321495_cov17-Tisochrysis_lutea.AAC.1
MCMSHNKRAHLQCEFDVLGRLCQAVSAATAAAGYTMQVGSIASIPALLISVYPFTHHLLRVQQAFTQALFHTCLVGRQVLK